MADVNPVDVCIGFICPDGKNILGLADVNPTGIGGSGNIVGGVGVAVCDAIIDVDRVDAGRIGVDVVAACCEAYTGRGATDAKCC